MAGRTPIIKIRSLISAMLVVGLLASFISTSVYAQAAVPVLTTDKRIYFGGETMTITGNGFDINKPIIVTVNRPDGQPGSTRITEYIGSDGALYLDNTHGPTTISNDLGGFVTNYLAPGIPGIYRITATDGRNVADTHVADPVVGSYNLDQGKNGGVGNPPISPVEWVNGNLNQSGSHYTEGDSIPYRLVLSGLPINTESSILIQWDIRKSAKNAIDYITSPNRIAELVDPGLGIPGLGPVTFWDIPAPTDGVEGSPADIRNDSFTALSLNEKQIWGYNITGVRFGPYTDGSDTASDSSSSIVIYFTPTSPTAVFSWGGHIASQSDWGIGMGATGVSGSPYHMRILQLCQGTQCGGGNQDRSLSASAVIPNGTIIIVKDAVPNDSRDFSFNLTDNSTHTIFQSFLLDDDADTTLPNSRTFSVPPGMWTASEIMPLPTDWHLTSLTCIDPTNNTTVDLITGNALINLASLETVTCTFTDTFTNKPAISIDKTTNGSDGPTILIGQPVNWSYVVTNTGNVPLSGVAVTDNKGVVVTCPRTSLAIGENMTCNASGTAIAGSYNNIGTASGAFEGTTVTASDPSWYFGADPKIDIQKTPDLQTASSGGTANFTILVTNTGNVPLTDVTVTDPLAPNCATAIGNLALSSSSSYTCSLANVSASFTNVATVTGKFGTATVTDNDDAVVNVNGTIGDLVWNDADRDGIQDVGEIGISGVSVRLLNVSGTVLLTTITNSSGLYHFANLSSGSYIVEFVKPSGYNPSLQNQGINDNLDSDADTSTGRTSVIILASGQTDYSIDAGFWTLMPLIDIEKTPDTQTLQSGETAHFTIAVTNTGDVPLTNVAVTDPRALNCELQIGDLTVGASRSYQCELKFVTAEFTNVATVSGTYGSIVVTDSDDAFVKIEGGNFEVGGDIYPASRLDLLAPWALLIFALGMSALLLLRRRVSIRKKSYTS